MKILVTGATGNVGGEVVRCLIERGIEVRALARKPESVKFPTGVEVVPGDLTDPDSIRAAMNGVEKLFLLNAVVADELTQALITYGIAKRAAIKHVAYVSVYKADRFLDVPHFASKVAVENALKEFGIPYTILRPGYFFQNDLSLKPLLENVGIYPMPIGNAGISAIDSRDVAGAAAVTLTQPGHEGQTYNLVSSSQITGPGNAALWSKALGKPIAYTGEDFDGFEKQMSSQMPAWMAYDMRTMLEGYVQRGFASTQADVDRVTKLLGRAPRTYEALVQEAAGEWSKANQR
ncbi:NmrA family NAD(P)-binding protein [Occallatibacter savannae]|uniref:NmrA family NAD(P)-binding protein n=1 Tax=Occallatibacter savannae TaxID=1002691 RepID=UPI000D68CBB5|nr:NmrA family NAD(P)-binding protein [Occallatibacter savannae]